ncbi:MAG: hypothetical protein ABIJ50_04485 [Pseudomonadota bacterium]
MIDRSRMQLPGREYRHVQDMPTGGDPVIEGITAGSFFNNNKNKEFGN